MQVKRACHYVFEFFIDLHIYSVKYSYNVDIAFNFRGNHTFFLLLLFLNLNISFTSVVLQPKMEYTQHL